MKIEIEWNDIDEAFIRIEGREIKVKVESCSTSLEGLKKNESVNTLGGIIAAELYAKIGDFIAAEQMLCDFCPGAGAWKKFPKDVANEVYERATGF